MKTHRYLLLATAILLVLPAWAAAQSRTDEARDRMKGESDSEGEYSFVWSAIELSLDILPELFYFRPMSPAETRMGYTAYPFQRATFRGIRSFEDDAPSRLFLTETHINMSMPQGRLAMEQRAADLRWHAGYWVLNGRYDYQKEAIADYGIHQFLIAGGRKFRFMPNGDAGLMIGYRNLRMGGDRFDGPELGVYMDWYLLKPVSLSFYSGTMGHEYASVENTIIRLGVHKGPVRFTLGHQWLDIAGVDFNTLSAGVGVYF